MFHLELSSQFALHGGSCSLCWVIPLYQKRKAAISHSILCKLIEGLRLLASCLYRPQWKSEMSLIKYMRLPLRRIAFQEAVLSSEPKVNMLLKGWVRNLIPPPFMRSSSTFHSGLFCPVKKAGVGWSHTILFLCAVFFFFFPGLHSFDLIIEPVLLQQAPKGLL